jgi:hypothetical protein
MRALLPVVLAFAAPAAAPPDRPNDYPEGVLDATPQAVLKNVRNGNLGPKGQLLTESKGTFGKDKRPTREFTYISDKWYVRNRLILVGDRLYQIMLIAPAKADLTSPSANKMYGSFALKPVK